MSFLNDVLNKLKKQDGNSDSDNNDEGIGQRERGRQPVAEHSEKKQETEKAEKREQPSLYEWRPGGKKVHVMGQRVREAMGRGAFARPEGGTDGEG